MFTILFRVFSARHQRHVAILLGAVVVVVLVGAELFALAEGLPFTTGLYWAVTSATTVGYGDVTPHNPAGRLIASLVMLTTIPLLAAAFALISGAAAASSIRRVLNMRNTFPEGTYRLIVGLTATVPAIMDQLVEAGFPVVLVADVDPATVREGVHVIRGNPTDEAVIAKAKPQGAEQGLITGDSDGDVLVSAVLLRKLAPSLVVTALVDSPSVREALADLGVRQSVSGSELVSHLLTALLETPHAGDMIRELVGSRETLSEIDAAANAGKRLSAVRGERGGLVLGLVRNGEFTLGLDDDPVITAADRLLVAQTPHRG